MDNITLTPTAQALRETAKLVNQQEEEIARLKAYILGLEQKRAPTNPVQPPVNHDEIMNIVARPLKEGENLPSTITLDIIHRLPRLPGILAKISETSPRCYPITELRRIFVEGQTKLTKDNRLYAFQNRKLVKVELSLINTYSLKLAKIISSFNNAHKIISDWITSYAASEPPKHVHTKIQGHFGTTESRDIRKHQTSLSVHADNIRSTVPTLFRLINTMNELVEEFSLKLESYYEQQTFIDPISHHLDDVSEYDHYEIPRLSTEEYSAHFRALCSKYSIFNERYEKLLSEVNSHLGTFSLRQADQLLKKKLKKEAKDLAFEKVKEKRQKEAAALLSKAGVDTLEEKLEAITIELLNSKNATGRKNKQPNQAAKKQQGYDKTSNKNNNKNNKKKAKNSQPTNDVKTLTKGKGKGKGGKKH